MPTISATFVKKPRKVWYCESMCNKAIRGPHVRLYGYAERGDKPYSVRICLECAMKSGDKKTMAAAKEPPHA